MPHPTGRSLPPVCFLGIPQNWVRSCGIWDGTDIYISHRDGAGREEERERGGGKSISISLFLPFFYVMHVAPWRLAPIGEGALWWRPAPMGDRPTFTSWFSFFGGVAYGVLQQKNQRCRYLGF